MVAASVARVVLLCGGLVVSAACAGRAASSDSSDGAVLTAADAAAALEKCCGDSAVGVALRIAADYKEPSITTRRFTAGQFWQAAQPMAEYARFDVATVGQSLQGRLLRTITIGSGPTRVLVWSRMNGGESTGTIALADIVRWFANTRNEDRDVDLRERLLSGLTIMLVPILNPDEAESADTTATAALLSVSDAAPIVESEARVLTAVRDKLQPQFAIALVERGAGGTIGTASTRDARAAVNSDAARNANTDFGAAVTLLAQHGASARSDGSADDRALRTASTLAKSFLTELPGRVARYDDVRDLPLLSGLLTGSRVSTVVVASGNLAADPQNQRLRLLHVAALLSVFDAMATGAYTGANAALYEQLPRTSANLVPTGR